MLTQIIFEQENKEGGQNLLPITFLRQLIRFYGDSMQMLVPRYLEVTIDKLTKEQQKFRDQFASAFDTSAFPSPTRQMFGSLEETARKNMAMFSQALTMFSPFARTQTPQAEGTAEPEPKSDLEDMKRQLDDLQKRLEGLSPKDATPPKEE